VLGKADEHAEADGLCILDSKQAYAAVSVRTVNLLALG
jgi:hypothetical protein